MDDGHCGPFGLTVLKRVGLQPRLESEPAPIPRHNTEEIHARAQAFKQRTVRYRHAQVSKTL